MSHLHLDFVHGSFVVMLLSSHTYYITLRFLVLHVISSCASSMIMDSNDNETEYISQHSVIVIASLWVESIWLKVQSIPLEQPSFYCTNSNLRLVSAASPLSF